MKKRRTHHTCCQIIAVCITILLIVPVLSSFGEQAIWGCPGCGRTGNIGNYCGGCGHASPWIENENQTKNKEPKISAKNGDHISLGHYPQNAEGNDNTPIDWLVLDVQGNKALLISTYGLDAKPYNTEHTSETWEACTLRKWLNGEFMNTAFSTEEQSAVLLTAVDNSREQGYFGWNTDGSNQTQDRIFLLSYAEAKKYFGVQYFSIAGAESNPKAYVTYTAYAVKQGAQISDYSYGYWWLRSPGRGQSYAAYVNSFGSLGSRYVGYGDCAVRPALWLDLTSDIF